MSLKCPLSFIRMELPCRSSICNHNQCFDATSFLQVQQQAPQWACPICNKVFKFENLVVDQYVETILRRTSKSTEQITIEPNGTWRSAGDESGQLRSNKTTKRKADTFDDYGYEDTNSIVDDDFLEISFSSIKSEPQITTENTVTTPMMATKAPPTGSSGSKRAKRTHDTVIDLTLSSDEDCGPSRPVKRQSQTAQGLYHKSVGNVTNGTATPSAGARSASRISFGMPSVSHVQQAHQPQRPADEPGFYNNWAG